MNEPYIVSGHLNGTEYELRERCLMSDGTIRTRIRGRDVPNGLWEPWKETNE